MLLVYYLSIHRCREGTAKHVDCGNSPADASHREARCTRAWSCTQAEKKLDYIETAVVFTQLLCTKSRSISWAPKSRTRRRRNDYGSQTQYFISRGLFSGLLWVYRSEHSRNSCNRYITAVLTTYEFKDADTSATTKTGGTITFESYLGATLQLFFFAFECILYSLYFLNYTAVGYVSTLPPWALRCREGRGQWNTSCLLTMHLSQLHLFHITGPLHVGMPMSSLWSWRDVWIRAIGNNCTKINNNVLRWTRPHNKRDIAAFTWWLKVTYRSVRKRSY